MIVETYIGDKQNTRYGKYFLSTEAPEDEEQKNQPGPKHNTKVIEVKPNNRSRIDFTDDSIDDNTLPNDETNTPDLVDNLSDSNDYVNNNIDDAEANPTDNTMEDETDQNIDIDTSGEETDYTDITGEEENDDTTSDDPDTGDEEDFASDADEQTYTTSADDTSVGEDENKRGAGLEYDSTRKYMLFKNYISLVNAIENYITKLESKITDDIELNQIIKTSIDKLKEIKDLAYDYMVMKFEISSYIQSLLFFQNLIVMVQLVFNLLSKLNQSGKK